MNTREKDLPQREKDLTQREKDLTQREKTVHYSPPKSIRLRHVHCYTDQDAMKRMKSLCVRFPRQDLENFLLRAVRLSMQLAVKTMPDMRKSSSKRSRR